MSNAKPRPCAHCRSKAFVFTDGDEWNKHFGVQCSSCGIQTGFERSLAKVLEIWNRREKAPRRVIDSSKETQK